MNYAHAKKSVFTVLYALFFWFSSIQAAVIAEEMQQGESFDPSMFYLVDQVGNNFLFRGNMPQMNGIFADADLTSSIMTTLSQLGIPFSSPYILLDLSLLNTAQETAEISVEENWFKQNPAAGSFWLNSLYGTFFNPLDFPDFVRNFMLQHYDFDGLKSLIPEIKSLLEQQSTNNFVIYMHCNAGKDRTGEAAACYLMHYKGLSYKNAVALNTRIAGRPVHDRELNAARWYAFYLRDIEGISTIGTIK